MTPPSLLRPVDDLDERERERSLRYLLLDGVSTQVMGALTGGALLVAFALLLGASNTVIGLIAAVGPLTQLLQIPAVMLVERLGRRKALVVVCLFVARLFWMVVAAIPWIVAPPARVPVLMMSLAMYFSFSAVSSSAYNSWKRDLMPDATMGRFLAQRLAMATAAGAAVTLAAGFGVDWGSARFGNPLAVYSLLFLGGGVFGLLGVGFLGRIPEPRMEVPDANGLLRTLAEPLRDLNFRQLLIFLASWNFAINLAAPFFSVYMLARLGLPVAWVLGLSVISQVANVSFFPIWGRLADRFSNRAVLGLSGMLFVVCIAIWPFTTMPERYALTVPLLISIHVLAGISTAGVNLCAGGITLKLAPRGKATSFLAANALASGIAATVAPTLGGILADSLSVQRLSLQLKWETKGALRWLLTAVDLEGLDFLFVIAVLCGLYALHRLLAVQERGEVEEDLEIAELYHEVRKAVRHVGNVAGLRRFTHFPYALLRWTGGENRTPETGATDEGRED
jgi:Na+/melibiose symporter-like transporter